MHLPNTSKAVALTAPASTAAAIAVPNPEPVALAQAAPTPAPTATKIDIFNGLCSSTSLAQSQQSAYSLFCAKTTSTGARTFFGHAPATTYVTKDPYQPWKKTTVTGYTQVPTNSQVAVCTKQGTTGGWFEIDVAGNQVGLCSWGNHRNPSRCVVM